MAGACDDGQLGAESRRGRGMSSIMTGPRSGRGMSQMIAGDKFHTVANRKTSIASLVAEPAKKLFYGWPPRLHPDRAGTGPASR